MSVSVRPNWQISPWEVGLGFTVAKGKTGFRGAEACQALKGQEKIINAVSYTHLTLPTTPYV